MTYKNNFIILILEDLLILLKNTMKNINIICIEKNLQENTNFLIFNIKCKNLLIIIT